MRTLYLDCGMGAAGDMLTAALLELVPDQKTFLDKLNRLGVPGVTFETEKVQKCGIYGTHMIVKVHGEEEESEDVHEHHHHHEHSHDEHCEEHHHTHEEVHEHPHEYEHAHEHEHHHEHEHPHEHEHHHEHEHPHEHEHHHEHGHHHSSMHDVEHIVAHMDVAEEVKQDVLAVYRLIAEAESVAHNKPVSEIHFHEVGNMDAIADVTAVCLLLQELKVDEIVVSPVHVGSGQVHCAHGILPVPAPATAYILKDVPIYGGRIKGELCTPTGAALLKHFATRFGEMPVMHTEKIGYGMGKKDFEAANCVRAMLGTGENKAAEVYELECNVDDMTAEELGFAMEVLLEAGALEVFHTPVVMKKSRPGTLLCVICKDNDREKLAKVIFANTSTIGIREKACKRYVLERSIMEENTELGKVRVKKSEGYGVSKVKYEYDDVARIAKEKGISIREVREILAKNNA